ncbi:MAG TPA: threonine/serine dehydratase [Actinomycetota bacterium]|nr:threonine/serine dehydratase [Actinomycetota bacterium]
MTEDQRAPEPSLGDILAARRLIDAHLPRTPFRESIALGRQLGLRLWIKYENHQPVGAFKVRGNINKVLSLDPEERLRGVVTASMGNHGQGLCYAARLVDVHPIVVMPESANPDKVAAMRDLGAEIVFEGRDFDEADAKARELEAEKGLVYFHAADDPWIVAGHGTIGLEMLEAVPDLDALVVPVGAGGLISGVALAAKAIRPEVEVIGVQAKACAPYLASRREGRRVEAPSAETFAEGLAARVPTSLPFAMIDRHVDDLVDATEEELRQAILLLLDATHNLAEGAGAAGTAGVVKLADRLAGKRVGTILSGGNLPRAVLERALCDPAPW